MHVHACACKCIRTQGYLDRRPEGFPFCLREAPLVGTCATKTGRDERGDIDLGAADRLADRRREALDGIRQSGDDRRLGCGITRAHDALEAVEEFLHRVNWRRAADERTANQGPEVRPNTLQRLRATAVLGESRQRVDEPSYVATDARVGYALELVESFAPASQGIEKGSIFLRVRADASRAGSSQKRGILGMEHSAFVPTRGSDSGAAPCVLTAQLRPGACGASRDA